MSFGLYLTENTLSLNYKQPNHVLWENNHKFCGQNSEIFFVIAGVNSSPYQREFSLFESDTQKFS